MALTVVLPSEGDKVRFKPCDRNAEKSLVGVEGEVVKRQDFILHVKVGDNVVYARLQDVEVVS